MLPILNFLNTNSPKQSLRTPAYLSPSSFLLHLRDTDLYVKRYIADPGLPWDSQTEPMAFGSAFDSFVKHALVRHLYGEQAVQRGEPYHLETLFASTVDPEQQAWAWETGKWAFSMAQPHWSRAGVGFSDLARKGQDQ